MLRYVYHALESFQSVFSRQGSWLLFAAVVLSLHHEVVDGEIFAFEKANWIKNQ
jgi:hypothetical protein